MKNNKMPDTSLIPAQQVNAILKMILNELSEMRTRDEKRGATYKAVVEDYKMKDPVMVIPVSDAPRLVRTECPESVLKRIDHIESVLPPLIKEVKRVGDGFASQANRIDELKPKKHIIIFKDTIVAKVFFALSVLWVIICFIQIAYVSYWSDDAWARRGYDAALSLGREDPGLYYDDVRKSFRDGYPKTARGNVRDIEAMVVQEREYKSEEVQP